MAHDREITHDRGARQGSRRQPELPLPAENQGPGLLDEGARTRRWGRSPERPLRPGEWEHPQLPLGTVAGGSTRRESAARAEGNSRTGAGLRPRTPALDASASARRSDAPPRAASHGVGARVRRRSQEWRMDERTRAAGRRGLAAARAALEALDAERARSDRDAHAA